MLQTLKSDGILGLSLGKIGSSSQSMLVESLYRDKKLAVKGFTMFVGDSK